MWVMGGFGLHLRLARAVASRGCGSAYSCAAWQVDPALVNKVLFHSRSLYSPLASFGCALFLSKGHFCSLDFCIWFRDTTFRIVGQDAVLLLWN